MLRILRLVKAFLTPILCLAFFLLFVLSHSVPALGVLTARGLAQIGLSAVSGGSEIRQLRREATSRDAKLRTAEQQVARLKMSNRDLILQKDLLLEKNRAIRAVSVKQQSRVADLSGKLEKIKSANMVSFRGKKMAASAATLIAVKGLARRTKQVATANLASTVGESIPFYGIAIIVAATGYEITAACHSMRDIHELKMSLGETDGEADVVHVCGLKVPSKDELWATVKNSPSAAWESTKSGANATSNWAKSIEAPDFGGMFSRLINWF